MSDAPAAPRSESLGTRWLRRTLGIAGVHVALWLLVGTIGLWLPLLALWDALTGGRFARVRFVCFTCTYLTFEVAGLYGALGLWFVRPWGGTTADRARHYVLQHLWVGAIFKALEAFYGLRVVIETPLGPPTAGGSPIVFMRHASVADTLLPGRALSLPFGLSLRYVLKRELLVLPCLDVVGQRLPNMWVRRSAKDTAGDLQGVRALAQSLSPGEGVLIYPEGTRSEDGRLKPFRRGFMLLQRKSGADVVPMAIAGSIDGWPKGQRLPWPSGRVQVKVGPPILASELAGMAPDDALDRIRREVSRLLDEASAELRRRTRGRWPRERAPVAPTGTPA